MTSQLLPPQTQGLRNILSVETRTPDPSGGNGVEAEPNFENSLDFISSDATLDRYSESISPAGWKLDAYLRNPVFQNAHQYGDIIFTLGRALLTEVRTLSHNGAAPAPFLFQRIQFAVDANPMARIAYALYKGKFLNAVSVGFMPLRWVDADGVEHNLRSAPCSGCARGDIQQAGCSSHAPRRRYLAQELLEVSAVAIPANPNALALAFKSGAVEKSDITETVDLLRQLTSTAAATDPFRKLNLLRLAREFREILRSRSSR